MFKFIKKIVKKGVKKQRKYDTTSEVSFKDSTGKEIVLEIKVNGNNTLLIIKDKKSEVEFALDKDCTALLAGLVQSYILYDIFPDLEAK